VNFYMLIPANTNQAPHYGSFSLTAPGAFQNTNKLVFTATAGAGATIAQSNITLTLDGVGGVRPAIRRFFHELERYVSKPGG